MISITIRCDVPDDIADPDDNTGLTSDGYDEVFDALGRIGLMNVQIEVQ